MEQNYRFIKTEVQLRWNDFDILKHLYNGQYQAIFDLGRSDYIREILKLDFDWEKTREGFITAAITINFHSQIVMNERVEVLTRVSKIGNKSITLYQEIRECNTGELKADEISIMVGYDPVSKESFVIPEAWKKAIAEQEQNLF